MLVSFPFLILDLVLSCRYLFERCCSFGYRLFISEWFFLTCLLLILTIVFTPLVPSSSLVLVLIPLFIPCASSFHFFLFFCCMCKSTIYSKEAVCSFPAASLSLLISIPTSVISSLLILLLVPVLVSIRITISSLLESLPLLLFPPFYYVYFSFCMFEPAVYSQFAVFFVLAPFSSSLSCYHTC